MSNMKRREDAVSPVIGVMLMIVVTIIIAAIVSAFAGDLSGGNDKKTAPMASIQCQIVVTQSTTAGYPQNAVFTMKHISGDAINTQYLRIIVSRTNTYGTPLQQRTGIPGYAASGFTNLTGSSVSANVPYLTDAKAGDVGSTQTNFGNYIWVPGQVITTGNAAGFTGITGITLPVTASSQDSNFKPGDIINIKLVDTNTQKTIVDQDVTVQ